MHRVSGGPSCPDAIVPRRVTLRDQTVATIVPFSTCHQVPASLLRYLSDQFNKEIEGGDTYPMIEGLSCEKFASYWFQNFGAICLMGNVADADEVVEGKDWAKECLGTFYIKPNYPGRSSHVCNAGFIVTDANRKRGVGRLMGEAFLSYAPRLGYTYSVFNLVYETNVASCRIWDALGFKRIGRVKGCGRLRSYPDEAVDALIYGRELRLDENGGGGGDELVSEERFDKIKFYLKHGRYPNGANRAEKSRLRSAATHYKLLDGDVLMLKAKEVIADLPRQTQIARRVHKDQAHAGINKTTAMIAEKWHWSRIKETVSDVIKSCPECKAAAAGTPAATKASSSKLSSPAPSSTVFASRLDLGGARDMTGSQLETPCNQLSPFAVPSHTYADADAMSGIAPSRTLQSLPPGSPLTHHDSLLPNLQPYASRHPGHHDANQPHAVPMTITADSHYQPIDPQIISQPPSHPLHRHHDHPPQPHYTFQSTPRPPQDSRSDPFHAMALLSSAAANVGPALTHPDADDSDAADDAHRQRDNDAAEQAAVDRDLEMLIESQE